jgi:hypothetical protein
LDFGFWILDWQGNCISSFAGRKFEYSASFFWQFAESGGILPKCALRKIYVDRNEARRERERRGARRRNN